MNHRRPGLMLTLWLAAPLALVGCRGADPWDLSDEAWRKAMSDADRRAAQVDTLVQPGTLGQDTPAPTTDATPDGAMQLTVEHAVVGALQHNRSLAVQQLDPQIASTFAQIEASVFDPRLTADGSITKERRQEVSRATGASFDTEAEARDLGVGLSQRLPTGTDVGVDVTTGRDFSNRTPDQHESRVGLTVTQALLRGFGPAVNLVSVRQAKLDEVASQYELRGFTEALVADTETAYWQAVLARQQIAIFERALEVSQQFLEETRQRVDVGVLAESEVAVAQAEIAQRRQELIDARSREERARLLLLRLINPQDQRGWEQPLELTSLPTLPDQPADNPDEHMALARRHRPDINEARIRLDQDRLEVIRTRNGLLPVLELFVTLGKTGFADSFSKSVREMDGPTYDLTAGARFEMPLGNREAQGRYRQSLLTRQQASLAVNNLVQLAELDVQLALVELDRARQQVAATAATVSLRRQALENEVQKLRVGKSTNLLVAQAGRDLLASRLEEAQAIIQVKLALIDLYRLDGTLLRRRGVVAPGDQPPGAAGAPAAAIDDPAPTTTP
jgi:outer membrane protein TolC